MIRQNTPSYAREVSNLTVSVPSYNILQLMKIRISQPQPDLLGFLDDVKYCKGYSKVPTSRNSVSAFVKTACFISYVMIYFTKSDSYVSTYRKP